MTIDAPIDSDKLQEVNNGSHLVQPILSAKFTPIPPQRISNIIWTKCLETHFFHLFGGLAAEDLLWLHGGILLLTHDSLFFRDLLACTGSLYLNDLCEKLEHKSLAVQWEKAADESAHALAKHWKISNAGFVDDVIFCFSQLVVENVTFTGNRKTGKLRKGAVRWWEARTKVLSILNKRLNSADLAAKSVELKKVAIHRLFTFTYERLQALEFYSLLSSDTRKACFKITDQFKLLPAKFLIPFLHGTYNPVRGYCQNLDASARAIYEFLFEVNCGNEVSTLSGVNVLRLFVSETPDTLKDKAKAFGREQLEVLNNLPDPPTAFPRVHNHITQKSFAIQALFIKRGLQFYLRFFFVNEKADFQAEILDAIVLLNEIPCFHKLTPVAASIIYQYFLAALFMGDLILCKLFCIAVGSLTDLFGLCILESLSMRLEYVLKNSLKKKNAFGKLPRWYSSPVS